MNEPRRLPAYFLAFVGLGASVAIIGPALPSLAANTNSNLAQISYIFLARALGDMAGAYLAGKLYDKLPGHAIMIAAIIGLIVTLVAIPFAASLWTLLAVAALLGVSGALLNVGGNTVTVWLYGARSGPPLNGIHFSFALGAFAAPIVFAQSVAQGGGAVWAFGLLALFMLPPLGWIGRLPGVAIPPPAPAGEERADNLPFTLLACFFLFLFIGSELSFGGWLYTYALALGVAGETTAAYLTSAFYGAIMIGRLAAIWLAARVRPRTILLGDLLLALASIGLIVIRPLDAAVLWLGVVGLGLGTASLLTTLLSLAERRIRVTGRFTSWLFMSAGLGATFFPWLTGQLFVSVGPLIAPGLVLINLTIAFGVALLLVRKPG
jgi:FHS family Na+ dependent glucose MFS transporter 1